MLTHHAAEPIKPGRVVVLGAGGFVGRGLAERLRSDGTSVLAVGSRDIDLSAAGAGEALAKELKPDDALIFLSALTPDKGRGIPPFLANLRMGEAVCTALEKSPVAHVVYISSDAIYPFRSGLVSETSCAEPTDLYGAMHLAREIMVKGASKAPVAILRPTLIYGAGDTHNSYGPNRLRRMAHKDGRISLFGEGEETRDHIYVDDAVGLIRLVVLHRSAGTLNVASGRSIAFADLARLVAQQFAKPVEIKGSPRQNAITYRAFDVTAVHKAFPSFRFTSLEEGLALAHEGEFA